jgi:hypothetical protein
MTGRAKHIAYSVFLLLMWGWLAYSNFPNELGSGAALADALLDLSVVVPLALVPLTLVDIWKYLTAERVENIVNPHFVLEARQPLLTRLVLLLISCAYITSGVWHLARGGWSWSWSEGFNSPIVSVLFMVLGAWLVSIAFLPRTYIAMSPQGLDYSHMRPSRVSWHDIIDLKLHSHFTTSYIDVTLKDSTEFRSANLFSRWHRVSKLTVMPAMFGIDGETLMQAIDVRRNVFTF